MPARTDRPQVGRVDPEHVAKESQIFSRAASRYCGVSRKVLTEELRTLVRDGLVERRTDVGGKGVQYALTALGKSLCRPINQLRRWAEQHADQIERAQARFDEPAPPADSQRTTSRLSWLPARNSLTTTAIDVRR